jgi:hypothetical protein
MPGDMTIRRETVWNSVPRFAMKLDETPVIGSILGEDADQISCYSEMIAMLNLVDAMLNLFGFDVDRLLGPLLRLLWRKHEKDLKVGSYKLDKNTRAYSEYNKATGELEVYINVERDRTSHDEWHAAYESIFHEFFHNIFDVARIGGINLAETDIIKRFGKEIETEVNTLLAEENDKNAARKRLKDLTFYKQKANRAEEKKQKRYRAALFDIIGAVFYRGKYGCHPPNSQFYTHDGKPCVDKKICQCIFNADYLEDSCDKCALQCGPFENTSLEVVRADRGTVVSKCEFRTDPLNPSPNDKHFKEKGPIFFNYRCRNKGACIYKNDSNGYYRVDYQRMVCNFENNCWSADNALCYKLWGHGPDYWEPIHKSEWKKHPQPSPEFLFRLADETFAHMAAEAIANPAAYEYMVKYLPQSYEKFKKILKTLS